MAIASVIYGVRDGEGKKSHFEINLPDGLTIVEIVDFATGMVPLVLALINGGLVSVGLSVNLDDILSVGDDTASASSDVEEGARFQFETNGGYATSVRLPTFDEAKLVSGTNRVNQVDADVIAFNLAMLTGIGGTSPCDKRGDDITGISFEREDFQSSRA